MYCFCGPRLVLYHTICYLQSELGFLLIKNYQIQINRNGLTTTHSILPSIAPHCKDWSLSSTLHTFQSSGEMSWLYLVGGIECGKPHSFSTPFWIFNLLIWKIYYLNWQGMGFATLYSLLKSTHFKSLVGSLQLHIPNIPAPLLKTRSSTPEEWCIGCQNYNSTSWSGPVSKNYQKSSPTENMGFTGNIIFQNMCTKPFLRSFKNS